ncbi:GNAT family N-acetyltransferase [Halorussus salilacus]|uniref:GNAT family N-acetyltransferase n=1 Tax=Halorussus salilacus TaxID=2953750 RepID=UPI00209FDEC2|nr:GNAT family N-acetyltransferase [Halorussus salilacus]USZ67311.1 GNAT family N-acetyltransferase [Halorussus salilacus]
MEPHPNAEVDTLDADGLRSDDPGPPTRLSTDRLVLHRAHPDTVEFGRVHDLFRDGAHADEVFELCGWDAHADEAETRAYLDEKVEQWERGEFFEYVVDVDGEYVGTTCLEIGDDGEAEFGLWLCKSHWGRGFSREVTDALTHVAFESLTAPYIAVGCLPSNERSRRALERFVARYGGAYYGSPPTVPSRKRDERAVVAHHEWVVTRDQFDSAERGISTLIPGVEYDDVTF